MYMGGMTGMGGMSMSSMAQSNGLNLASHSLSPSQAAFSLGKAETICFRGESLLQVNNMGSMFAYVDYYMLHIFLSLILLDVKRIQI